MKAQLKCSNCGFEIESEMDYYLLGDSCLLCKGTYKVVNEEEVNNERES